MSDYTWLAQPVATVSAAVLALGAATIAYLAAQAGVREQRRIAVRREVFDVLNELMQSMLELQNNAQQAEFAAYRPPKASNPYTDAIAASPGFIRKVVFSAYSVKILGFPEIADTALTAVKHFGAAYIAVQDAIVARGDESLRKALETKNIAMREGQKELSKAVSEMENELSTSRPDALHGHRPRRGWRPKGS